MGKQLEEIENQAYKEVGEVFNLSSPKQLGVILFEEQKIPVLKKTPTGTPSTAEEVLQELALDYPLPKVLMEYRGLAKLKSTGTPLKSPIRKKQWLWESAGCQKIGKIMASFCP